MSAVCHPEAGFWKPYNLEWLVGKKEADPANESGFRRKGCKRNS
jgi:hypothetical protein